MDLRTLNPPQRKAAETLKGALLILAGAGTGKTRVITYRIANLMKHGVGPDQIVGLTFTNKAGNEMRERLTAIVGGQSKKVFLGTFHSFCLKILRAHGTRLGLPRKFSIVATSDQLDLTRRAIEELGMQGKIYPQQIHSCISWGKNKLLDENEFCEELCVKALPISAESAKELYLNYEAQLRLHNAIDFDDCIFKTIKLLREHPEVQKILKEKYKYYLVDEFQDTNASQLELIRLLVSDDENVCVVGDDDQSIYSWRGASPGVLDAFLRVYKTAETVFLEQNYRSTKNILHAANTLIQNNTLRKDKKLWSEHDPRFPIMSAELGDERAEADWVAQKIFGLLGQGQELKDICVLYRSNAQAKHLEFALREYGVNYKTFGGQSLFEKKEIKDFLAYLRIIVNQSDKLALWRVINTPSRGVGVQTLEKLSKRSVEINTTAFQALEQGEVKLIGKANTMVPEFLTKIRELSARQINSPQSIKDAGQAIIQSFGLVHTIKEKTKSAMSRQYKVETLCAMPGMVASTMEYMINSNEDKDVTIHDVLDRLCLDREAMKIQKEDAEQYVSLMTVHAAKGLEYPSVFVVGMEEGLFPHKNSMTSSEDICEERRLCYVALTRAKQKLFLSNARLRSTGFHKEARSPSRFLKEINEYVTPVNIEQEQKQEEQRLDVRKARTLSRLQQMRDAFDKKKIKGPPTFK